jgi:transposase
MQKIKDVLRLHLLGGVGSCRQLARAVGCGKSAVADCLRRAKVANLSSWTLVAELDEMERSRRLYPTAGVTPSRPTARPLPDWTKVREELARRPPGVSAITVPDNLKSAIKSPDRYEAEINPAYRELAEHYGTCIIAARVKKPRDKGKVEAAVLVAQRWILAVLRHQRFYHIEDLNHAIGELLTRLNDRVMRHVKQSRRQLYERLDRPALKALPVNPYEYAE